MNEKKLGNTDVSVSELCLGTMYFGTSVNEKSSFAILDYYVDQGGNFIDTANNYCYWAGGTGDESEELLGKWMAKNKNRNQVVLASKIGARPRTSASGAEDLEGLQQETIIKAVEASLKRLATDRLDVCYLHADLKEYPLEERLEALEKLRKQGKIVHKACSNIETNRVQACEKISVENDWEGFQAIQQKYSMLQPTQVDPDHILKFVTADMIQYAESHRLTLLPYSVLLSGAYEKGWDAFPIEYKTEENRRIYQKLLRASLETSMTCSQLVISWLIELSECIVPIVTGSSVAQIKQNLDSLQTN